MEPLLFALSWKAHGLTVRQAPGPVVRRPLAPMLQRSLDPGPETPPPRDPRVIPVGFLAQVLLVRPWAWIDVVLEPCPDRMVRLYLSLPAARLLRPDRPVHVEVRGRAAASARLDAEGNFTAPPLPPGRHAIELAQDGLPLDLLVMGIQEPELKARAS